MKHILSAGVALAACLAFAAPSQAAISGAYSVTFNSTGTTQCLILAENGALGNPKSGTWYSSTFPNWGGTFEILKGRVMHLVGPYGSPPNGYTTFDGIISGTTLINSTFDEFDTAGTIISAGSITVTKGTCSAAIRATRYPSGN